MTKDILMQRRSELKRQAEQMLADYNALIGRIAENQTAIDYMEAKEAESEAVCPAVEQVEGYAE